MVHDRAAESPALAVHTTIGRTPGPSRSGFTAVPGSKATGMDRKHAAAAQVRAQFSRQPLRLSWTAACRRGTYSTAAAGKLWLEADALTASSPAELATPGLLDLVGSGSVDDVATGCCLGGTVGNAVRLLVHFAASCLLHPGKALEDGASGCKAGTMERPGVCCPHLRSRHAGGGIKAWVHRKGSAAAPIDVSPYGTPDACSGRDRLRR